jgi:cephalosporin hydroxylase
MSKFHEDLRVYQHVIWLSQPDVVIEIGAQFGGSALWFRDRRRALAAYGGSRCVEVVSVVELDAAPVRAALSAADPDYAASISLVEATSLTRQRRMR